MKIKVYLNDWFVNAGIIGFLRILKNSNDEFAEKKSNYIEFETEDLRNFEKYYFKYFMDKYDVAKKVEERTARAFEYIENNIEIKSENKEEKQIKEKIKSNKKYIKDTIKKQLDKIKKINEQIYNEIKEAYNQIDKEETKEGIIEIKNNLLNNIKNDAINKKLTLNLFKSILSNTYYGQVSFLNVIKTALSYEEQQELMYMDYISNIVETGFIHDILEGKYNIEQIKEQIETKEKEGRITKEIGKIYSKIKKDYIEKCKNLEEIQKYIKEKVLQRCCMCENELGTTTNFSEGNFVPLAISSDNARNFFWNQNVKFPICDVCKLILFCIPAGVNNIIKTVKENGEYKEKQLLNFVNYDTNIDQLLITNNNFKNNSKYENRAENPYTQLILDIVEQDKKISEWQLQNIFVVEFDAEYGAYSRIEYFNIRKYVAQFFTLYASSTLNRILDYKYKLQVVDYILKNKDIKYIINDRLRDDIIKPKTNSYNSFLAIQIRKILNILKKEKRGVEEIIDKNNKKLYALYNLGIEIHEELKHKGEENKLSGYTYKMLNSIKTGNKEEFMQIVIKLHMSIGKGVSSIFLETRQETNLDFESIGQSFLAGLISNKYEKKTQDNDEL